MGMTPEEFRRHGHELIDWIAEYLEHAEDYPVVSRVQPGEVRSRLAPSPPHEGEPFEALMRDLDEAIMPGITHWQSPNFFAFFPANTSYPSVLGDLLSSGLGVQGMLWATSPACTEVETLVMDWLVEMLGLPAGFRSTSSGGGVMQDTASTATLVALIAAREQATGGGANRGGVDGGRLTVYASSQAHSSVEKDVRIAGIGSDNLRLVDVDGSYAMRPEHLRELIRSDRASAKTPVMVVATVGTTSSGAVDPLAAVGAVCRREGVWLHVDAAMAGTAGVCPEYRWVHEGLEYADSYVFNPHKWMGVGFDCSAFYVADRQALTSALGIVPEYLRNEASESGVVIDYRDWQVQLGRRFRALKLWFTIRNYGVSGLQEIVRRHVALAQEFASWVESDSDFEMAAPAPLNLVCFRHRAGDDANRAIVGQVNASGAAYLTHTVLHGKITLRMSIGQRRTERQHVKATWRAIQSAAQGQAE
jgi:aromatic-L-amino-acid decarboxylase